MQGDLLNLRNPCLEPHTGWILLGSAEILSARLRCGCLGSREIERERGKERDRERERKRESGALARLDL